MHFNLFGDANTYIDWVGRLAENSIVNGTATTANSSTTPVKDGDVYLVASSKFDELDLCLVQFPAGGKDTAIFTAIRVAQHDLLLIVAGRQLRPVDGMGECALKYVDARVQIVNRLKKRDNG